MSKLLVAMLRRFLTLGAGEESDETDPPEGGETDTGDTGLDDMLEVVESAIDPKAGKVKDADEESPRERAARERAEAAERRAADAESRYRAPPPSAARDPDVEREDKELADARAAGWTPESIAWLTRTHATARSARAAERTSQSALTEAREMSDKTQFDRLEATKPGVYKKYADRVEKAIADARAAGQTPPPRLVVLRLMVGDDFMNGKFKTTPKGKPAAGEASAPGKVDRGRMPAARTDVNGKTQAATEREKRRERLRNTII